MKDDSPGRRVIAVDIGNTRVKVAAVDSGNGNCRANVTFATADLPEELPRAVARLSDDRFGLIPVVFAAVVGPAAAVAEELFRRDHESVIRFTTAAPLPLTIQYNDSETLGIDRLANALYAVKRFPDCGVIIVSAGTAIVVDYVADGMFHGGAILPGVRLQMECLHHATDALPMVDIPATGNIPSLPATSTRECISGGVVRGCAAAVDAIITGYAAKNATVSRPVVIGTGGDWPLLQTLVSTHVDHHPQATLSGIALAFPYLNRF
ncbi:MAG: type III pantothenate kinase [Chitinispirillaceae bacterium]|nr:type III pantothenate kinase [Chitinispirillaceae bacterium]